MIKTLEAMRFVMRAKRNYLVYRFNPVTEQLVYLKQDDGDPNLRSYSPDKEKALRFMSAEDAKRHVPPGGGVDMVWHVPTPEEDRVFIICAVIWALAWVIGIAALLWME